jgi:hypothetical protein
MGDWREPARMRHARRRAWRIRLGALLVAAVLAVAATAAFLFPMLVTP